MNPIVDKLAGLALAGLTYAAAALAAWRDELEAELATGRSPLARERAAAARCRPCPVPPPVPRMLVNGRPAVVVARS
jgi:hypothetical protein